nr:HepT-like ribonuclease domain-containing protein [Anabaena sp. FACHB-1237]
MTFNEFAQNDILMKAILYDFVVIGEAVMNIPSDIKSCYPQVPWRVIGDMRNAIAHEYFQVNLKIIWNTIQNNLPELIIELEQLLQNETRE